MKTQVVKLVAIYGMASLRCDRCGVFIGLGKDTYSITTELTYGFGFNFLLEGGEFQLAKPTCPQRHQLWLRNFPWKATANDARR
jgi:hypothetical protein